MPLLLVTAGDATHLASTSLVSVPLRFSVTATTVPATAVVGSVTRFGGAVAPARPGGTVWLEGLWSGAWHFIGTATLTDHSSYSFKLVPTRVSTYVYRVYKPADATLVANATPSFTVVTHA